MSLAAVTSTLPDQRCFIDATSLRVTATMMAVVMVLAPSLAFAQSVPAGVTQIVPDGRTATSVQTGGGATNITTSTISGGNAFNSFSQFRTGSGTTVNLQVPSNAGNLINMVHDSATVINGTVNAYKNGQIGGNVYFADPYGFVVGKSGTVNVGSLTVTTPTKQFMDSVISPQGQINQAATNQLINGDVPLSPDGHIAIRGRINAQDGVRLTGQSVVVGGTPREAAQRDHAAKFAASVNSKGLRSASGIVVRNGSIQIVAADSARINGRLSAGGHRGRNGGHISVAAGKDISVGPRARLSTAAKQGNGGDIIFKADRNLDVKAGAQFDTSSQKGDAGNIELSAKNTVTLASAIYKLSAPQGHAGTLLVDPTDIVIAAGNSMQTMGGSVSLIASNSITIASDGVIDTRNFDHSAALSLTNISRGDSGSVTLTAPSINVAGKILTETVGGYSAGDVMLIATASQNLPAGPASATTGITVTGTITGHDVQLLATSTAVSSFLDSGLGITAMIGTSALSALLGLNGGYLAATANANITIGNGAKISGTRDVTIAATGNETVADPAISLSALSPASIAVVVAELNANVGVHLQSGASVQSGGNLTIKAENTAALSVSAIAVSFQAITSDAVAYTVANVQTSANVDSGATVASGNNLTVLAHNQNSFSTTATAAALGAGAVGFAVAYSDVTTSATANFGANLGASATPSAANLVVAAVSNGDANAPKNVTSASTTVGTPTILNKLLSYAGSKSPNFLDKLMTSSANPFSSDVKVAGSLSMGNSNQSASASIAASTAAATAPAIYTTGNVAVVSRVQDIGVRNNADSAISSQESFKGAAGQTESLISVAAGVSIGNYGHNSNAFIGPSAIISAGNIGVSASTEMPITITWLTYDSLGTWLGKLNGNLGTVNEVLTTYANASTEAKDLGFAGSFNYFSVTNNTTAWVGSGATLVQSGGTSPWSVTPVSGTTVNFANPVTVQANTYTTSIDIGGNISWFGLTGSSGQNQGGQSKATSVGASATVVKYDSNTVAGIGDGVSVTANAVDVEAKNTSLVIAVGPTSGAGGATGINGIVALLMLDDVTHASISNRAAINAASVTVNAADALSTFVVAGAVGSSQNNAVGVAIGYAKLTTDTAAYIGANSADITGGPYASDDPAAGTSATSGHVYADSLSVTATTYGIATSASVAATLAASSPSMGSSFLGKFLNVTGIDSYGAQATGQTGPPPTFSLSLSGSSAVDVSALTTRAYIDGATIDRHSASGGTALTVQAVNNTILQVGSGSAALDFATNSATQSAALAGAVAVAISGNATTAYINNTTASHGDTLSVLALAGGQSTIVGLGLAINGSANQTSAASFAGSVSIGDITDSVVAYVSNSSLGADTASTRHYTDGATVAAYQTTDIGIGGGALYAGGRGGFGFAFTYVRIADPSGGKAVNAYVANSAITDYYNFNMSATEASRIASGAALAGFAQNGLAVSLVVNEINPTVSAVVDGSTGFSTIRVNGQDESYTVVSTYYMTVYGPTAPTDTSDTHYALQYAYDMPAGMGVPAQHVANYLVTHTAIGTAHGDVTVAASGSRNGTFDGAIASAANPSGVVGTSKVDFSGAAVGAANTSNGASIISVAGVIQGGQNSLGFAVVANTIGVTEVAQIAHNVNVSASHGNVIVASSTSADILGIALGASVSTGQFAGLASSAVNIIGNTATARIGDGSATPSNTQITANNVVVQATDSGNIRGAAGTLAIGTGGAAAGLSIVYDKIGNTVTAEINGAKVITAQDVRVVAASSASILTVALGIAAASSVGIAGSVATSILRTNVTADTTGGADVTATGNALVQGTNVDTIQVIAGAAGVGVNGAGVGISVVVNDIGGDTAAYISGSTTKVEASGASGSLSVNNGVLSNGGFNLSSPDNPSAALPDLSEQQRTVRGLAVVASSHQAIVADAVTLGLSFEPFTGDALALVPVTNLMSGSTKAYIDSASIDTRLTTAAASGLPQVYVGASSESYTRNLVIAAAGAGGFAGAGAASATRMQRTTLAYMNGATIGATVGSSPTAGDVVVNAASTQVSSNVVVGFAIGFGGGAASVLVNTFSADTEAYVDGGSVTASTLTVDATSTNGYFAAAGAGGAGVVGVAGAFAVGVSSNTTRAYIGDDNQQTTLNLSSGLSVVALSNNTFNSFAIGGALGGAAAVAGMGDFTIVNNTTEAKLDRVADTQSAGDVTVSATENVNISPTTGAGALALSGSGVGAAVNVVLLKSHVAATVLNSGLTTTGAVNVTAAGNKTIDAVTATLGAASSVGIGASTGVVLIGTTAPADASNQLAGTLSAVDGTTNGAAPGNGIRSGNNVPANNQPAGNQPAAFSVASTLGSATDAVTAEITGGTTQAGSVNVTATATIATSNQATGVGVGAGAAGVGAAVAYSRVNETVTSSLTGAVTAPQVSVTATTQDGSGHAVDVQANAGAGGLGAGVGAAVADGAENNTVTANLGGTVTGSNAGTASVNATDSSTVRTQAVGAAIAGGAALGASASVSSKTSTVAAMVAASTTVANYTALTVAAAERGTVSADAIAGAGGLAFAGNGAGANASDSGTITASIGQGSTLTIGNGDILVAADGTPQASASAVGVSVAGGFGVGASVALATVTPITTASIGDSVTIHNAPSATTDVTVRARNNAPVSGHSVSTSAIAGSGGLLFGGNATVSTAQNNGQAAATVGNSLTLGNVSGGVTSVIGALSILATNTTDQYATTTGVSAGYYAVGFNVSSASSDTSTTATLGNTGAINATSLSVSATGNDSNDADATAGTGGVVAGNASSASTSTTSTTTASIGTSDATHFYNLANGLNVAAAHTTTFNGSSNSVNASLVGGSGALLHHDINSTVNATIADNAKIRAQNFTLTASNTTTHLFSDETNPDNASWNLQSGSGGLLNLPAGRLDINITQNTTAAIGNNEDIHILAPSSGTSTFRIEAVNTITAHDKARLDSGGLIALADTRAYMNVTNNATVSFGRTDNTASTILVDAGDVQVGAWTTVNLDLRVASTTWGFAGAPTGTANITYVGTNEVDVRRNTRLESTNGAVTLAAGDSPDGLTASTIGASATIDLYNKTAIPIPTTPDPQVSVNSVANVAIDSSGSDPNSGIRSAGDMSIYADRGTITMNAVGTGKDIYREALAAAASAVSNLFGGGDITFDYHGGRTSQTGLAQVNIDGVVMTGIQRTRYLTISYDFNPNNPNNPYASQGLLFDTNGITFTQQAGMTVSTTILVRLAQLQNLLSQYAADPIAAGAYASEILFLKQKLIAMGLATGDPTGNTPSNPFIIGSWAQSIQQAYSNLQRTQTIISSGVSGVLNYAPTVVSSTQSAFTASTSVASSAGSIVSSWGDTSTFNSDAWLASQMVSNMANLSKWGGTGGAGSSQTYTDVQNLISSANSQAQTLAQNQSTLNGALSTLNNAKNTIAAKQADITTQNAIVASPSSTQSAVDAAYLAIKNDMADMYTAVQTASTAIATIKSTNTTLQSSVSTLNTTIGQLQTKLTSLAGLANSGNTADTNYYNANIAPKFTQLQSNITGAGSQATSIGTQATNTVTASTTFGTPETTQAPIGLFTAFGAAGGVGYYQDQYTSYYNAHYVADSAAVANASSNLSGNGIIVGDVTARLGNLNIKADRLTGSGQLMAPGDAQIAITNNTANILVINNLTINSDSGGRLRLNGVLVDGNTDINALNRGGGSGAAFTNVVTAKTQAALGIYPSITIQSNYQPDTTDPTNRTVPLAQSATPNLPAPDIQLASGSVISNPLGSVVIQSKAGNIYSNGQINANTVTINVKNGDFVQSYVFGFDHVAGDPAGTGLNGGDPTLDATGGGIVANGAVFVSARYLNINGLIQSGIDQWTLNLSGSPTLTASAAQLGIDLTQAIGTYQTNGNHPVTISVMRNGQAYNVTYTGQPGLVQFDTTFAMADYNANHTSGLYQVVLPSGSNLGASYDASHNQYVADATQVLGGYVQLYGQIMNTSPTVGRIRVLDGFGQINVTNTTGLGLVLNTLDTGQDPSGVGRGVAGVIDITNVSVDQATNAVSAVHTVYTRNSVLNQINVDTTTGTLNTLGQVTGTAVRTIASGDGRNTQYTLTPGLRYVYTTGTDQSTVTYLEYHGVQLFGTSALTIDSSVHASSTDGPHTLSTYRISNGTYIKIDTANDASTRVTDTTTHNTGSTYVKTAEWTDCNWWTLCTSQDHYTDVTKTDFNTVITTNSLKANYPISIQFGGSNTGAVNVTSTGAVTLNGVINNKNGTTSITGASIVQNDQTKQISSTNISLTATNGSVGAMGGGTTAANPIQINLTNGGALTASATNGNVVVNANRDMRIGTVTATGDATNMQARVILTAGGDILARDANSYIQAANVNLTASNGAIGSAATPLMLRLGDVDTTTGFVGYYGLTASAANDINLATTTWSGNTNGDMLVNKVTSLGGNVTLTAPGRIIDNNPIQSIDTRTFDQLLAYWTSLGLIDGTASNAAKQNAAVQTFQSGRTADYQTYWQIRMTQADGGATFDPNFHYTASAAEQAILIQQGINVASYEATRTAQYIALNAEVGSYTATYNAGFHYQISPTERTALLNGGSWTQRELAFSLSPGALKTITGTNPIIKDPNVSGLTVTLNAGQGLGQALANVSLDTRTIPTDLHNLTDAQKAAMVAIAAAERSDFVNLTDPYVITVSPKQPLNFAASTALNVNVTPTPVSGQPLLGTAYLASLGDALLGDIDVSGETRIKVRGSIVNATPTSSAISTGDLILEASVGGVGLIANQITGGYDDKPLRVAVASGSTLVARAQSGIDITSAATLLIDTVYSPNDIKLTSTNGSLLNANNDQLINILGRTVTLTALQGTIGAVGHALNVGNNLGGGVIANAGTINLYGPQGYQLVLRQVTSAADVTVTAALDAVVDGPVTSAGRIEFDVNGLLSMTSNAVVTSTAGAVAINTGFFPVPATSQLTMAAGSQIAAATGITIVTGGNATASSLQTATGDISLTAGGDGSVTSAQVTDPASGRVLLTTTGALSVGDVEATGTVKARAGGAMTLAANGTLTSRGDLVDVGAASLTMLGGSTMSGGQGVQISTSGDVVATTLTAAHGNITVTSGGNASVATASIADPAAGQISYQATGSLVVGSASSAGPVQATAGGSFTQTAGGQIVSRNGALGVTAGGDIVMGQNASMTGVTVALTAAGDAVLGALVGTANPAAGAAPVVSVTAGSPMVAGAIINNGDGQTNITTVRPNASVALVAGGGIGVNSSLHPSGSQPVRPIVVNVPLLSAATTTGDINIVGLGDLHVTQATAPTGAISLASSGALAVDHLTGQTVVLNTQGDLTVAEIDVARTLSLGGRTITANIVQIPGSPSPLQLNLTGPNGGIAQTVAVNIDAPSTAIGSLFAIDAGINSTGTHVGIANGFVPGMMVLTMAGQYVVLDNRSVVPMVGPTVQMYGPNMPFTLDQTGTATTTSNYVVSYGPLTQVTALDVYQGMSFIRDVPRDQRDGDIFALPTGAKGSTFYLLGISPAFMLDANLVPKPVESTVEGPAVNLDGLQLP